MHDRPHLEVSKWLLFIRLYSFESATQTAVICHLDESTAYCDML